MPWIGRSYFVCHRWSKQSFTRHRKLSRRALGQNQVVNASLEPEGSRTLVGCGQPLMEEQVVIVDVETLTNHT
jgi:hypothetical protein